MDRSLKSGISCTIFLASFAIKHVYLINKTLLKEYILYKDLFEISKQDMIETVANYDISIDIILILPQNIWHIFRYHYLRRRVFWCFALSDNNDYKLCGRCTQLLLFTCPSSNQVWNDREKNLPQGKNSKYHTTWLNIFEWRIDASDIMFSWYLDR